MVIAPGRMGVSFVVILSDDEHLPAKFNKESAMVFRRGTSTQNTLKLIKPLGKLAESGLLRPPVEPVCTFSNADGNPVHVHADGSWWFYDETWAYENGPFESKELADGELVKYCETVLKEKEEKDKITLDKTPEA